MADPKTPNTTSPGDGAATPSAAPSDPVPNAGAEPVTQAAAATSRPAPPPLPSEYEMPDDYADEDFLSKAKVWAESNPVLAVLAAAGAGLLVGRLVTGLAPEPEPASLTDRIEARAKAFSKDAKKQSKLYAKEAQKRSKAVSRSAQAYASDAGESVSESLHRAADALRDAAGAVGDAAGTGVERTKDLADTVGDAVKVAVAGVLAKKVDDWMDRAKR